MNSKLAISMRVFRYLSSGVLPIIITCCDPSASTNAKVDAIDCVVDSLYVWNKSVDKESGVTNVVISLKCPKPRGLFAFEYRKNDKEWIKSFHGVQSNTDVMLNSFGRNGEGENWMEEVHLEYDLKSSFLVKEGDRITIRRNEAKSMFELKEGTNVLEIYISWIPE